MAVSRLWWRPTGRGGIKGHRGVSFESLGAAPVQAFSGPLGKLPDSSGRAPKIQQNEATKRALYAPRFCNPSCTKRKKNTDYRIGAGITERPPGEGA